MARVPLVAHQDTEGEAREFFDDVVAWLRAMPGPRAGGAPIPQPWRALVHSPFAARYAHQGGQYFLTTSPFFAAHGLLRQLAIVTLAVRVKAPYVWIGHWPVSEKVGMSRAQFDALTTDIEAAKQGPLFDAEEKDIIEFADQIAKGCNVDGALFETIRTRYDNEGAVELMMVCGFYLMVSTFCNVLDLRDD